MKAELRRGAPKGFVPFEVVFKLDTIEDAEELYTQIGRTSLTYCYDLYTQLGYIVKEFKNG